MVTLLHPLNLEGPLLTTLEHLTNNVAQTKPGELLLVYPTLLKTSCKKAFLKNFSKSLESPAMERRFPAKSFSYEFS